MTKNPWIDIGHFSPPLKDKLSVEFGEAIASLSSAIGAAIQYFIDEKGGLKKVDKTPEDLIIRFMYGDGKDQKQSWVATKVSEKLEAFVAEAKIICISAVGIKQTANPTKRVHTVSQSLLSFNLETGLVHLRNEHCAIDPTFADGIKQKMGAILPSPLHP